MCASSQDGSSASAPSGNPRIGEFVLERELGRGGMSAVFLARKEKSDQQVALKVMNHVSQSDPGQVTRFRREAKFLLALAHPNIVGAYEVGAADGRHYLSMELVKGESLKSLLGRHGRIDAHKAMDIMRQIASALDYGSRYNVVHRDLKPSNILLTEFGVPKLADMGLAILAHRKDLRLTAPGMAIGTPTYMSPEQARAEREMDARSDIYSLGCTIYHAICGRPPIEGPNAIIIAQNHLTVKPRPASEIIPTLDPKINDILMKCLEKDPADRYQTCASLKAAIIAVLDSPNAKQASGRSATGSTGSAGSAGPAGPAEPEEPEASPSTEDSTPEAEAPEAPQKRPSTRVESEFLFSKTPVPGRNKGDPSTRSAVAVGNADDRRPSPMKYGGPPTPVPISQAGPPGHRRGIDEPLPAQRHSPHRGRGPRQNPARRAMELILGIGAILAATAIIWMLYN